jgi:DNA-binding response OmpR family regulator
VGETSVVDVHVSHLRQAIDDNERRIIRTVYGVGYSFRTEDA